MSRLFVCIRVRDDPPFLSGTAEKLQPIGQTLPVGVTSRSGIQGSMIRRVIWPLLSQYVLLLERKASSGAG